MGNKIGVPVAQRLNVPNFFKNVLNFVKDVPNFINDVPNFVNDVPSGPKSVSKWSTVCFEVGNDLQSLLKAI